MNPTLLIGAVLVGVAAAIVYFSGRPDYAQLLGKLRAMPRDAQERVWVLSESGGLESALARARDIQAQGYNAVVTDNLEQAHGLPRLLSAVTDAELDAVLAQEVVAQDGAVVRASVLPPLG